MLTSSAGSRPLASTVPELAPEGELAQVPIGDFTTEAGAVLADASFPTRQTTPTRADEQQEEESGEQPLNASQVGGDCGLTP